MEFMEHNKERIENMDEGTFDAVSIILSLPKKIFKKKKHVEGDDNNMCKAMKDWIAYERNAGMKEGIKEGMKEGEKKGIKKGIKEGETRFASLTSILLSSKRLDDLNKAVSDEEFRNSLYQEFAL